MEGVTGSSIFCNTAGQTGRFFLTQCQPLGIILGVSRLCPVGHSLFSSLFMTSSKCLKLNSFISLLALQAVLVFWKPPFISDSLCPFQFKLAVFLRKKNRILNNTGALQWILLVFTPLGKSYTHRYFCSF